MNEMNEKVEVKEVKTEWVFIPLKKAHIFKRTPEYVLFDIDGSASGIVNTKFLRKKETEDMVFLSLPENYTINCNYRSNEDGRWKTIKTTKITAKELRPMVLKYNKKVALDIKDEDLPF